MHDLAPMGDMSGGYDMEAELSPVDAPGGVVTGGRGRRGGSQVMVSARGPKAVKVPAAGGGSCGMAAPADPPPQEGGMVSLADIAIPAVLVGSRYAVPAISRETGKAGKAAKKQADKAAAAVKKQADKAVAAVKKAVAGPAKKPAPAAKKPAAASKKPAPAAKKPAAASKKLTAKKPAASKKSTAKKVKGGGSCGMPPAQDA